MLGLLKMCYACLETNEKELIEVSKMDFDSITFLYKLRACVSLELEEDCSKHICATCVKQLRISYRFREMVLLSQETLSKHKNEIFLGAHTAESKLNQFRTDISNRLFEPECVLVKQELANSDSPLNTLRSRRNLRSAKAALIEELEEKCFPEIPADNGNDDTDSSDYLLADLKNPARNNQSSVQITNGDNISDFLVVDNTKTEEVPNQYQCAKCNIILESFDEEHSCDGYDVCDNSDTKEQTKNSKDTLMLKTRRGRPKKRVKMAKPEVEYECYHCSLVFNKRWKLQKHITRVHSDSKKYVCTYCNKGFKQSYHLREHLTSHTGERNYTCSFCDKSFQRISSMRRHIRSHEAAPGQKTKRTPFLCTVCGKSFPFSNGVQRHMRIHLGIKNHECTICQRRFTQSTHLHVHMRTHTGEKPYICDTCGEAFSLNASLQKHMSVHLQKQVNAQNKHMTVQQNIRTNFIVCKKLGLEELQ